MTYKISFNKFDPSKNMAARRCGQFPLCTYRPNFKPLLLKPVVKIENDFAEKVNKWPLTKIAKRDLICQKYGHKGAQLNGISKALKIFCDTSGQNSK